MVLEIIKMQIKTKLSIIYSKTKINKRDKYLWIIPSLVNLTCEFFIAPVAN